MAEVVERSGSRDEYQINEFTRDGIIRDFLHEYAKWIGW